MWAFGCDSSFSNIEMLKIQTILTFINPDDPVNIVSISQVEHKSRIIQDSF